MVTEDQADEFRTTGLLRLPGAFPPAAAEAMRERLWEFLAERDVIDRDAPTTWRVAAPTGFQPVTHSGAFHAVGSQALCTALDALFGADGWVRPRWWGRPLVTFPGSGRWELPAAGWHFDFMPASAKPRPVQYFAFLGEVPASGGGTLVLSGSHRLVARYLDDGKSFRMGAVRTALTEHPWLRELWAPSGPGNPDERIQRYLGNETTVDGVPLRVVELTGQPGDVVIMHSDTFHAAAPNRSSQPRMMLTEMIAPDAAQR
ncbi:phytanoyl-CoA dioxygenase family protein [Actinospica robiniae]|uniref:phytanoyl-CoA dioxygenase family protein n=1 Tax=Actinospica robiniae TaxID=304901 RepID=UPI00040DEB6E|nr:phytanoyl-CoA dioxygenase family protein [Actinospica robiniae]